MVPPHTTTLSTPGGPATAPSQLVTPPSQITPTRPATAPDAPRKTPMPTPSAPAAKRQRTEKSYAVLSTAARTTRATVVHTTEANASPTPTARAAPATPATPVVPHGMTTRKRAREVSADWDADTVPERAPAAPQEQPQAMIAPAADEAQVITKPAPMTSGPEHWPPEIRDLVAVNVRAADPTTLLRLVKITPVWELSCVHVAVRYATEFFDFVASGYAKLYDTSVYTMARPRALSTCPRIVHHEKPLTIALPGHPSMANDMDGQLLPSETRTKFNVKPGKWWIPHSETIPVPPSMLRRIAFKSDQPFETYQPPRELLAFCALMGKRAHAVERVVVAKLGDG
ncbi:hypothetical protein GGF31_006753 [Allomyces arbusculus]|nr:hypothetical protein GGF31_006753 [Allomyces arbusculus]